MTKNNEWDYEVLPESKPLNEIKAEWKDLVLEPSFRESLESSIIRPIEEEGKPREYSLILFGPPGTGKTTVPHAIAKRLEWEFFYISPQHFFVKGASVEYAVTKCFEEIKEYVEEKSGMKFVKDKKVYTKPAKCVFVFDEIDEMVIAREDGADRQGRLVTTMMLPLLNDLRELAKLSGFIFFALTNHIKRFDPAIKRKGRFDLILPVGPPDRAARYLSYEKIIKKLQSDNLEKGMVIPDRADNKYDEEIRTVDLNVISLASERLGFGDIENVCIRVFEQHKLLEGKGLEDFLELRKKNQKISNYTLPSLDTSKFLSWINRQRNSSKDIQAEIDRYYEEYAIYSRGSSPNTELNQIQDRTDREFSALNLIDDSNDHKGWKATKNNKLTFEFRNLTETNTFDGIIEIELDGAGFNKTPYKKFDIRTAAGETYYETVDIKSSKKGTLYIKYVISGDFMLFGVTSMKGKLSKLNGTITKISTVNIN